MADDELNYTSFGIDQAGDIVVTDAMLAAILRDWPYRGLTWNLANEVARLRAEQRRSPTDWDGESYCVDCPRPATHQRLSGMHGDMPVTELVCCTHAIATVTHG